MTGLLEIEEFLIGSLTIQNVRHAVTVVNATRAFNYACVTVMVWDMLLTLSDELLETDSFTPSPVGFTMEATLTLLINPWMHVTATTAYVICHSIRYATPAVIAINIWLMTGLASGLSDRCRGWLSAACLLQVFSISSVSLAIALRLFVMYETTRRTLYGMIFLSTATLIASFGVMIRLLFVEMKYLVHEPIMNLCITIAPAIWYQWVPRTIEHGLLCLFLIVNAMGTPRSSRTPALAILYRDGILFYFCTFLTFLGSIMVWKYLGRLYMGIALCPTWIFCQIAVSHLLLDNKVASLFRRADFTPVAQGQGPVGVGPSYTVTHTPMKVLSQQGSVKFQYPGRVIEVGEIQTLEYTSPTSTSRPSRISRDGHRIQHSLSATYPRTPLDIEEIKPEMDPPNSGRNTLKRTIQLADFNLNQRTFWWMFRRRGSQTNIHVDIDPEEYEDADGGGWAWDDVGGVKESRLGRFDHWI